MNRIIQTFGLKGRKDARKEKESLPKTAQHGVLNRTDVMEA